MADSLNAQALEQAMVAALAGAWGATLGGPATAAAGSPAAGAGWTADVAVSGGARGRIVIWFSRESAVPCVKALLAMPADPADVEVADMLREVVAQAIGTLGQGGAFPDVTFGPPQLAAANAPAEATSRVLTVEGQPACTCAIVAELLPAATLTPAADLRRLDTVLDVELPLTVRFGQVVMPLRTLADLGPGSVVDMGRSPDEPVELLVGGRLIARGEVVVVSGHYGVRITELTGAQPGLKELEARAS